MKTATSKVLAPAALPLIATAAASWLALVQTQAPRPKPKVLLIADEGAVIELVSLYLDGHGLEVACVRSSDRPRVLVERGQFDLVIVDWALAGAEAGELLRLSKERHPEIPVIIYSGIGLDRVGISSEADEVVRKGGSLEALRTAIFRNLARRQVHARNAA